jgi:hemoglobin-like flavoprotein
LFVSFKEITDEIRQIYSSGHVEFHRFRNPQARAFVDLTDGAGMNARQIELVQETFAEVQKISSVAAGLFYGKLFELDPALKPLFRGDMVEQGQKLMTMLGVTVTNLTKTEVVLPALKSLGTRHAGYGVSEAHYGTVGTALLWTLERGLGEAFIPEVREAWTAVYTLVAQTMTTAAREHLESQPTVSAQGSGVTNAQ